MDCGGNFDAIGAISSHDQRRRPNARRLLFDGHVGSPGAERSCFYRRVLPDAQSSYLIDATSLAILSRYFVVNVVVLTRAARRDEAQPSKRASHQRFRGLSSQHISRSPLDAPRMPLILAMTYGDAEIHVGSARDGRYRGGHACHLHVMSGSTPSSSHAYRCRSRRRQQAISPKVERMMRLYEGVLSLSWA